ncbi:MAG: hypothetical protein LDL12_02200 [Anaerolinea sp.]|nr:hypothetical protein [Anaerolinea sp.]
MKQLFLPALLLGLLCACTLSTPSAPTELPPPLPSAPTLTASPAGISPPATSPPPVNKHQRLSPQALHYLGAFRLPGGEDRPQTFAYGGNAMTFNPQGDPNGAADGFSGSLFISGHDRMPYGELPDGGQIAEVTIPAPARAGAVADLPQGSFVQGFHNVLSSHFVRLDEIPRLGLLYLDVPQTGPQIHVAYGQHFETDPPSATHGWFSPNLAAPHFEGEWSLADTSFYSSNDYLLAIPTNWAATFTHGSMIGTGRFRDGGWSGMGPALFAYRPWDENGQPPPNGATLPAIALLHYDSSLEGEDFSRALAGYQHPDEWNGGAWVQTAAGQQALLFVGSKSNGEKYWYGYLNPQGAQAVCVDRNIQDFPTCRMADGSLCPPEDFSGCCDEVAGNCASLRGWWSNRFDAQILFYDTDDLARVATGEWQPWQPQPYAHLDIDETLFLNAPEGEQISVGWGEQRRYRIGAVAFDPQHARLYILELFADGAKPVVHVWQITE